MDRLARRALRTRSRGRHRMLESDGAPTLDNERIRQEIFWFDLQVVGVAVEPREIGVGELLRLDEQMQEGRRILSQRLEIVALENAKHLERRDPDVVRWHLPDAIAGELH